MNKHSVSMPTVWAMVPMGLALFQMTGEQFRLVVLLLSQCRPSREQITCRASLTQLTEWMGFEPSKHDSKVKRITEELKEWGLKWVVTFNPKTNRQCRVYDLSMLWESAVKLSPDSPQAAADLDQEDAGPDLTVVK